MTTAFHPVGRLTDGTLLLYTAPSRIAPGRPTETQFTTYLEELRAIRVPWIWIVDCRGTTAEHYSNVSMASRMTRVLREEHTHLLKETWVLFLNSWLRAALALFQAPVVALSGDRLELLVHLQRAGVDRAAQDWLLASVMTPIQSYPHRQLRA